MAGPYYVRSTDGSDADTGATWALAEQTAAAGIADGVAGDDIWLSQVHAEPDTATVTLTCPTSPGMRVMCGNDGAEPPTALATTAIIKTTGSFDIIVNGCGYFYGIDFQAGLTSGASRSVNLGNSSTVKHAQRYKDCKFTIGSSGAAGLVSLGAGSGGSVLGSTIELDNPKFKFGATGNFIQARMGRNRIYNAAHLLDAAGSVPTTLFKSIANCFGTMEVLDCDISDIATITNLVDCSADGGIDFTFSRCKLPASLTNVMTGTIASPGGSTVKLHNCDSGDTHIRFFEADYSGSIIQSTSIYVTAGPTEDNGSTHFAWKLTASANASVTWPLKSPKLSCHFAAADVGSSKTVTMEIAIDSATTLNDDDVWISIRSLNTSGAPLGTQTTDFKASVIAAATEQSAGAGTGSWTGLGGGAKSYKVNASFTPQEPGDYEVRVFLAKASAVIYVNPAVAVT